jgi:hypothetical protein
MHYLGEGQLGKKRQNFKNNQNSKLSKTERSPKKTKLNIPTIRRSQ